MRTSFGPRSSTVCAPTTRCPSEGSEGAFGSFSISTIRVQVNVRCRHQLGRGKCGVARGRKRLCDGYDERPRQGIRVLEQPVADAGEALSIAEIQ